MRNFHLKILDFQFLLNFTQLVHVSCSVMPDSLWHRGLYLARLLCPWNSPGKNTGVGCHFLLQGIFLTQGSNLCLLHRQVDFIPLSHLGSTEPRARISFLLGGGGQGEALYMACGILVPWPEIELTPSAVEAWRQPLNHQGNLQKRGCLSAPPWAQSWPKALTYPTTWISYCPSFWSEYELSLYI